MVRSAMNAGDPLPPSAVPLNPHLPQLRLIEVWRPLRYIGSRGPRVFTRQCNPVAVRYVARPDGTRVIWGRPGPWEVCDPKIAQFGLRETHVQFDHAPGVTFTFAPVDKGKLGTEDWHEIQALRTRAVTFERHEANGT